MAKKKMNTHLGTITSAQQFAAQKPRYNPYQTGHGAHGKKKYSRKRKHPKGWE